MPRAALQYAALAVLLIASCLIRGGNTAHLLRILSRTEAVPGEPVAIQPGTRTIASGPLAGDQILAIDGRPFNAGRQYAEAVGQSQPGGVIRFTLSQPDGSAVERDLRVPDRDAAFSSFASAAVAVALNLLVPIVAMGLGFAVVAIRPADWNAWLVLFLMLGFTETVANRVYWIDPAPQVALLWNSFWNSAWPICMLLFGIYFPTRSARDRRWPWIKYLLIAMFAAVNAAYWAILTLWQWDVNTAQSMHGAFERLLQLQILCLVLANGAFFANFRRKRKAESSADTRRRLTILQVGSWIGLGPVFMLALHAITTRQALFVGVPWMLTVPALLFLTLFPLTLAYVIVVERAMDLRFVIRNGVKYGLAKAGLSLIRAVFIGAAIYLAVQARKGSMTSEVTGFAIVGFGLIAFRQRGANRLSLWLDRKFFREAYDAEKVLADLAAEVGKYLEVKPLLDRVAMRVGETLHVSDIVILLLEGNVFRTACSTRPGEPMDIPASSRIVANLRKRGEPLEIYFDKPPLWLRSLSAEELQTLDFMRTQLLLPLAGRNELAGIVSLGPKRSEVPYSGTDIRLLQAVVWQAGMAIENSQLLASLAKEAANRERTQTELEIAREVQERLFPQSAPVVAGLRCAGRCRPAQGIGGDYYDYLQLANGKLGVAIGDVSGKGIAAALLMASVQAGLRGQALAGSSDLSQLMTNVNRLVFEASASSRYVTLFYGEYDPPTRSLCYVNAGHNLPFILRGAETLPLGTGGPVVGLLPNATYEQARCVLCSGDVLVAYTDGISEAQNEREDEWGEEKLLETARECAGMEPVQIIDRIFQAADGFIGAAKQYDDMTLVVIRVD